MRVRQEPTQNNIALGFKILTVANNQVSYTGNKFLSLIITLESIFLEI
jgi:hypothetical protein